MGVITFLLFVGILAGIFATLDIARARHRKRCEQLKAYIKFLESGEHIEDAYDGARWIEERAHHRLECDIQDINYIGDDNHA